MVFVSDGDMDAQQALIREAIEQGNGMAQLDAIMAALHETNAFGYTRQLAEVEAEKARQALAALPDSDYKQALLALADIAVSRTH